MTSAKTVNIPKLRKGEEPQSLTSVNTLEATKVRDMKTLVTLPTIQKHQQELDKTRKLDLSLLKEINTTDRTR